MQTVPQVIITQGDRDFYSEDIDHIRRIARRYAHLSKTEMIYTLCETLEWLTPAGNPKRSACTKLTSRLEANGIVEFPAPKQNYSRHGKQKKPLPLAQELTAPPCNPIEMKLSTLGRVSLELIKEQEEKRLCNTYLERYHYLGYKKPFGYRQRYWIESDHGKLGCIILGGGAKSIGARDRWIGWSDQQRLKNLPWVVNNTRFLIFPWVKVHNLASHVLGQLTRQLPDQWQQQYHYRPLLLETFVDPQRFKGSIYRAAGWEMLGHTSGEGLVRPGKSYQTHPKMLFVQPLQRDFRTLLCSKPLKGDPLP